MAIKPTVLLRDQMTKLSITVLLACMFSGACTSESDAARALRGAGYTDVVYTGYKAFACSEDDMYHTGFRAKGPTGQTVSGTVCSAWLKGSTIRLD